MFDNTQTSWYEKAQELICPAFNGSHLRFESNKLLAE